MENRLSARRSASIFRALCRNRSRAARPGKPLPNGSRSPPRGRCFVPTRRAGISSRARTRRRNDSSRNPPWSIRPTCSGSRRTCLSPNEQQPAQPEFSRRASECLDEVRVLLKNGRRCILRRSFAPGFSSLCRSGCFSAAAILCGPRAPPMSTVHDCSEVRRRSSRCPEKEERCRQNYAAASPNDPDLGEQAILKRVERINPSPSRWARPFITPRTSRWWIAAESMT